MDSSIFDFDRDGTMNAFERAAEYQFFSEIFTKEDICSNDGFDIDEADDN